MDTLKFWFLFHSLFFLCFGNCDSKVSTNSQYSFVFVLCLKNFLLFWSVRNTFDVYTLFINLVLSFYRDWLGVSINTLLLIETGQGLYFFDVKIVV